MDQWQTASNATSHLACDKGVFSPHVCCVQSLNGHRPNDGHNAMMLATISKTDAFLYWICALLMVSLFLQNHMRTSVTYWTCWWMPSAKLIVFERWEDQNINNAELTSSRTCITWPDGCGRFWNETVHTGGMIGAHADGSHGLDKENHLQVPSLQTNRF